MSPLLRQPSLLPATPGQESRTCAHNFHSPARYGRGSTVGWVFWWMCVRRPGWSFRTLQRPLLRCKHCKVDMCRRKITYWFRTKLACFFFYPIWWEPLGYDWSRVCSYDGGFQIISFWRRLATVPYRRSLLALFFVTIINTTKIHDNTFNIIECNLVIKSSTKTM